METCSFCNKTKDDVKVLIKGIGKTYICENCVLVVITLIHKKYIKVD